MRIAKREILTGGLAGKVGLRVTGCHGFCQMEPSVLVEPGRIFYPRVGLDDMKRIVHAAASGQVLRDLLFVDAETGKPVEKQDDIPFFQRQVRRVLSWNEKVDPIRIHDYIRQGGYSAAARVLAGRRQQVIDEVSRSDFEDAAARVSNRLKWQALGEAARKQHRFSSVTPMKETPALWTAVSSKVTHSIIEGMLIAAYGAGVPGVAYPQRISHGRQALPDRFGPGAHGTSRSTSSERLFPSTYRSSGPGGVRLRRRDRAHPLIEGKMVNRDSGRRFPYKRD